MGYKKEPQLTLSDIELHQMLTEVLHRKTV